MPAYLTNFSRVLEWTSLLAAIAILLGCLWAVVDALVSRLFFARPVKPIPPPPSLPDERRRLRALVEISERRHPPGDPRRV